MKSENIDKRWYFDEFKKKFNPSARLENVIRQNFMDEQGYFSIRKLVITQESFLDFKNAGRKTWMELQEFLNETIPNYRPLLSKSEGQPNLSINQVKRLIKHRAVLVEALHEKDTTYKEIGKLLNISGSAARQLGAKGFRIMNRI